MADGLLYFLIFMLVAVPLMMMMTGNMYGIKVKTVHAGTGGTHAFLNDASGVRISPFDVFYDGKQRLNPKNYEIRIAVGNCMAARGILNGNLLFIQKFDERHNKQISAGDILFIRKEKNGYPFYKIREFERFDKDNNAVTFYYRDENGRIEYSSSTHGINDIEGIVKMKFEYGK